MISLSGSPQQRSPSSADSHCDWVHFVPSPAEFLGPASGLSPFNSVASSPDSSDRKRAIPADRERAVPTVDSGRPLRNEIRTLLALCRGQLDADGLAAAAEIAIVEKWGERTFSYLVEELVAARGSDAILDSSLMRTATAHSARSAIVTLSKAGWRI